MFNICNRSQGSKSTRIIFKILQFGYSRNVFTTKKKQSASTTVLKLLTENVKIILYNRNQYFKVFIYAKITITSF